MTKHFILVAIYVNPDNCKPQRNGKYVHKITEMQTLKSRSIWPWKEFFQSF